MCNTHYGEAGFTIPRAAFTIAFIDRDSKLRVLTVKSSVVNAISYIYRPPLPTTEDSVCDYKDTKYLIFMLSHP